MAFARPVLFGSARYPYCSMSQRRLSKSMRRGGIGADPLLLALALAGLATVALLSLAVGVSISFSLFFLVFVLVVSSLLFFSIGVFVLLLSSAAVLFLALASVAFVVAVVVFRPPVFLLFLWLTPLFCVTFHVSWLRLSGLFLPAGPFWVRAVVRPNLCQLFA